MTNRKPSLSQQVSFRVEQELYDQLVAGAADEEIRDLADFARTLTKYAILIHRQEGSLRSMKQLIIALRNRSEADNVSTSAGPSPSAKEAQVIHRLARGVADAKPKRKGKGGNSA